MNRVFISYAHKDSGFVKRIVSNLEGRGQQVFYDERIQSEESWAQTLS